MAEPETPPSAMPGAKRSLPDRPVVSRDTSKDSSAATGVAPAPAPEHNPEHVNKFLDGLKGLLGISGKEPVPNGGLDAINKGLAESKGDTSYGD